MPLPAKSDYNPRRFKSHDKTTKRDMTAVEALERDVTRGREKGEKPTKIMRGTPAVEESKSIEETMPEVTPDIEALQAAKGAEPADKLDGKN
jgi:hypothetical protein